MLFFIFGFCAAAKVLQKRQTAFKISICRKILPNGSNVLKIAGKGILCGNRLRHKAEVPTDDLCFSFFGTALVFFGIEQFFLYGGACFGKAVSGKGRNGIGIGKAFRKGNACFCGDAVPFVEQENAGHIGKF